MGFLSASPDALDAAPDVVEVHILGLPVDVYLEAQEHNDAVLRELSLIVESSHEGDLPARLVELAREVEQRFARAADGGRSQVDQAIAEGRTSVDISITVPRSAWTTVARLSALLDEADHYCADGDLLTLASSPDVRFFRRWYTDQVHRQLDGQAPTPWPE